MAPRSAEECDALFERHMNAGELDALVALQPNAILVGAAGQPAAVGQAAIREALAPMIAAKALRVVRAERAGDDLALLYNDWSASSTAPDGATVEMSGKAIEIIRRQPDGTWRLAMDAAVGNGRAAHGRGRLMARTLACDPAGQQAGAAR